MKDIEIIISKDTRMVELSQNTIGNDGENLQTKLVFKFKEEEFIEGQARLEYYSNDEKRWVTAQKVEKSYEVPILSDMTSEGRIDMQLVITEGTNETEIPIFKSNMFYVYCNSSINAEIEQEEEVVNWIDQANVKLNEVENVDVDINDSVVTVFKRDGSTKSENVKGDKGETGEKGKDGSIRFVVVNELPTENIDESAIYMVPSESPDEKNTYEEYIYTNGSWESVGGSSVRVNLDDYATKEEAQDYGIFAYYNLGNVSINNNRMVNIPWADYKALCLRTGKFVPIVLYESRISAISAISVLVLPVINTNNALIGFEGSGMNVPAYNNMQIEIISCSLSGYNYANINALPDSGNLSLSCTVSKVLNTTNTQEYNPTPNSYNPATTKYVDDAIANAGGGSTGGTPFAYYYPNIIEVGTVSASYSINYSEYKAECIKAGTFLPIVLMCGRSSNNGWYSATLQPIIQNNKLVGFGGTGIQAERYDAAPTIIHNWTVRGLDIASIDAIPDSGSFSIVHAENKKILSCSNTGEYNPTPNSYNPATTKYVDDAIANAITNTLEGSY